jgi:murein DD-endopeptidase MepM/ murein hydrolase activator NlpD
MATMRIVVAALLVTLAGASVDAQVAAQAPHGPQGPRLSAAPARPEPGAIVRLTLRAAPSDSIASIRGSMAGEPLHFFRAQTGVWHAIGAVPVDASRNVLAHAIVEHSSGAADTLRVAVTVRAIPPPKTEPLAVDTQFTQPPDSATLARIASENERARDVGRRAHESPPLWTAAFLRPRATRITSTFGAGRVFNGRVTSRHLGVDFAGDVGEPVRAANRGVVALVGAFLLAGNVVYIDHGGGIVTGYFHLSKPLVAVGDTVARGQTIGLVGATGRVTGAHLHWSARYGTHAVNPFDLLTLDPRWYRGSSLARKS